MTGALHEVDRLERHEDGRRTTARIQPQPPIRLYTIAEAAGFLGVPDGWLRKKVTARLVPHTRLGKHVRFTDDHLRRIVSSGEAETAAEPPAPEQGLSRRARRHGPAA